MAPPVLTAEALTRSREQILAKGSRECDLEGAVVYYVDLEGGEKEEGRDTSRLKLGMRVGQVRPLWVRTFLETKIEGDPERMTRSAR